MAAAKSDTDVLACPKCGARFNVPASMAGKRARCGACGEVFRVSDPAAAAAKSDLPEYIGFECHRCATRMYGRIDDVGKKLQCPDCGTKTVVPPPPPPKPKNIPAALEGDQYELWDADQSPIPSELIARQPKYIAVPCTRCGTVMYAIERQVGQSIACPDCGTTYVVPKPPKPQAKRSVLTRDADLPLIDPSAAPGDRPIVNVTAAPKMVYEERDEEAYFRALEKSRRTGKPMEIDPRGRPIIPPFPLVTGVFPFLISPGLPVRWGAVSISLLVVGKLALTALDYAMAGGFAAIFGMCFLAISGVLLVFCSAFAASVLYSVIVESSEGAKYIQGWLSFGDWFGCWLTFLVAVMVSAIPGHLLGYIPTLGTDPALTNLMTAATTFVFLPIVLMSQLDINSPWAILSARVINGMLRCPFSWLLFYLEFAALLVLCGAATYFVAEKDPRAVLYLIPLYFVALLMFGRLFGRLGWRMGEAMPLRDEN
jgi:predicted Zn finger-like uncharacterized protein